MDFYHIMTKEDEKKGTIEVYPDFRVGRFRDLMVRGRGFYAIWDEKRGLWSTDEYDVQRLVDQTLPEILRTFQVGAEGHDLAAGRGD